MQASGALPVRDSSPARRKTNCLHVVGNVGGLFSLGLLVLTFALTRWASAAWFASIASWWPARCVTRLLYASLFLTLVCGFLRFPALLQAFFREPAYYDDLETGTWRTWAKDHVVSHLSSPKVNKHRFLVIQTLMLTVSITCLAWYIASEKGSNTSWWQFLGTLGGLVSIFSRLCLLSGRLLISLLLKISPPTPSPQSAA